MTQALVSGLFAVLGVGLSYWLIHGGLQSSLRRSIKEDMELLVGLSASSTHRARLEARIERHLALYLAEEADPSAARSEFEDGTAQPPTSEPFTWRDAWEVLPAAIAFVVAFIASKVADLPGDSEGTIGEWLLFFGTVAAIGFAVFVPLWFGGRWVRRRWPWLEM